MSSTHVLPEAAAAPAPDEAQRRFVWFAWASLAYCILVVLWGAYVRATGSGAGCGEHWPLCNGMVMPRMPQIETLIELSHRATSGVLLLVVCGLVFAAFRAFPQNWPVKKAALLSLTFCLSEILIGAGLVLFKLVAKDASLTRVVSLSAHLINTLILIAALTLTAWRASGHAPRPPSKGLMRWMMVIGLAAALAVGVSGAITALGDTLFPSSSVSAGIHEDFSATANFIVRLRVFHPVLAVCLGLYLVMLAVFSAVERPSHLVNRLAASLIVLVLLQLGCGALNVYLLAPVAMQITHLLLADLVWISLVLFWVESRA